MLFLKFGVQFILDKIWIAAKSCIAQDNENKLSDLAVEIVDLEKENCSKDNQAFSSNESKDKMMQPSSIGGASSLAETFGDGLLD